MYSHCWLFTYPLVWAIVFIRYEAMREAHQWIRMISSHTLFLSAFFGELESRIIINYANTCLHYLCFYVLHQQLGFFMASNYVIKRRVRRLGDCDNLGDTLNCWAKLKLTNNTILAVKHLVILVKRIYRYKYHTLFLIAF